VGLQKSRWQLLVSCHLLESLVIFGMIYPDTQFIAHQEMLILHAAGFRNPAARVNGDFNQQNYWLFLTSNYNS
jgi:hypothetical protein